MKYLPLIVVVSIFFSSCQPKCGTCPGHGRPNKVQRKAMKMERKLNRQAQKEKR